MQEKNEKDVINNNVILNLFQDLNRFVKRNKAEMLKRVQHDGILYNVGFTLIELLVVVLIIGILAAVALPQYQKIVDKTRAVEAIIQGQTLLKAHQVCYMTNGTDCAMDILPVEMPSLWVCPEGVGYCQMRKSQPSGVTFEISSYYGHGNKGLFCIGTTPRAKKLCASLGQWDHSHSSATGREYYLINRNYE